MTIHLPQDVERSIEAAVHGGLFVSVDDALATAWRCLEQQQFMPQDEPEAVRTEAASLSHSSRKPIWEVVEELRKGVPPEEFEKLPKDGAVQLDHYIYGSPKRPTA